MRLLRSEEAFRSLLQNTDPLTGTEEIDIEDSLGRVLSVDIRADKDYPPFTRSPVDGYAVRGEDIKTASKEDPTVFTVIDEVTAGHQSSETVGMGTAVRIMTGAPMPQGADCVVKQEDTDRGEKKVAVYTSGSAWRDYCSAGEEYRVGDLLLTKD